jgi:acetyltransferase-like isoleucine patch superfamily enzyme
MGVCQTTDQRTHDLRLRGPFDLLRRAWALTRLAAQTSLLTVRFNLHYFPMRTAVHLPVLLHRGICLRTLRGSVKIEGPVHRGMVTIGWRQGDCFDDKRSRTVWNNLGSITFRGAVTLGAGCELSVGHNAHLTFGAGLIVNSEMTVICRHEITVGSDCIIGWRVLLADSDLHQIRDSDGRLINQDRPVRIGDHVWVSCHSLVLKGAVLPDHTIVAAGSTVVGEVREPGTIIGGVPARTLRGGVSWDITPVTTQQPESRMD